MGARSERFYCVNEWEKRVAESHHESADEWKNNKEQKMISIFLSMLRARPGASQPTNRGGKL